jgi:PHD/YefM family antitoxin component YafN of YafNO toxin-antitoxin module
MNLEQEVKPISYVKSNAAEMLDYINTHKSPVIVTQHGEARGVLLDTQTYEEMINALTMMRLLQKSEEDIKADRLCDQEEVFSELHAKYHAEAPQIAPQ